MKVGSTLPNGNFHVHMAVMLDLVVLVCVLMIVSSNIVPQFGFSVEMAESDFLMDNITGEKYIVAVTAGEDPVIFLNDRRLEGGLRELGRELDVIIDELPDEEISRAGVILVLDRAVSRAMEQSLIEMVNTRNMRCFIAAQPGE